MILIAVHLLQRRCARKSDNLNIARSRVDIRSQRDALRERYIICDSEEERNTFRKKCLDLQLLYR